MKMLIALVVVLAGCATTSSETRVSTPLRATEFNSISSTYLARPTFVTLADMSDGAKTLRIESDQYHGKSHITFMRGGVAPAVSQIDKYLEWEAIAMARGDSITKDIGRSPAWSNGGTATINFSMHSGNAKSHYMVMTFCAAGTCLHKDAMFLKRDASIELKRLLLAFDAGQLMPTDASVYK